MERMPSQEHNPNYEAFESWEAATFVVALPLFPLYLLGEFFGDMI